MIELVHAHGSLKLSFGPTDDGDGWCVRSPTYLPAYLPAYLPTCLPAYLPTYLPT